MKNTGNKMGWALNEWADENKKETIRRTGVVITVAFADCFLVSRSRIGHTGKNLKRPTFVNLFSVWWNAQFLQT